MAIRLEWIILLATICVVLFSLMVDPKEENRVTQTKTKELVFSDTTMIEVNRIGLLSKAEASKGIRNAGILFMTNFSYSNRNIEMLYADHATVKQKEIYLDHNITLHQKEGYDYEAEHAVYNKKSKILKIPSVFKAVVEQNLITGDSLIYDVVKKEAFATMINAELDMQERAY